MKSKKLEEAHVPSAPLDPPLNTANPIHRNNMNQIEQWIQMYMRQYVRRKTTTD